MSEPRDCLTQTSVVVLLLPEFSGRHASVLFESPVKRAQGVKAAIISDGGHVKVLFVGVLKQTHGTFNAVVVQQVIEVAVWQLTGDTPSDFVFLFTEVFGQISHFQVGLGQYCLVTDCLYNLGC